MAGKGVKGKEMGSRWSSIDVNIQFVLNMVVILRKTELFYNTVLVTEQLLDTLRDLKYNKTTLIYPFES